MNDATSDFKSAKDFVIQWYTELIAPNDKLYDYIEDSKITWIDDLPIVNMTVLKRLQKVKPNSPLSEEIEKNTPNWDKERIADVDFVLIKMALCEFLKFPSIPVKATINEYLEIAKEYSTPKSSIFINGILDKLVKEYQKTNKFKKEGRGLE